MVRALLLAACLLAAAAGEPVQDGTGSIVFELMGENPVVLVGFEKHFTDYGALCLDEKGNNISEEVVYGGHVVDTSRPSVNTITYTCRGNVLTRKVVVKEGSLLSKMPMGWAWALLLFLGFGYMLGSQVSEGTKRN
jgi:hypothetical protein